MLPTNPNSQWQLSSLLVTFNPSTILFHSLEWYMRYLVLAFAFGVILPVPSTAQENKKDSPKIDIDVDIHFVNGSNVRMRIQSEKVEMETIYGKLTIPATDIRSIEFGLHLPDGFAPKIEAAVKKLGSSDFREREKASAELLNLGPYSYAAALDASRSKESEISTRARNVVQKLQAKFPKSDLKISAEDKIVTPTLTLTGRILATSLKAKADYFGVVELSLADMRSLRSLGAKSAEVALSIDAAKYAAQGQWLATNFQVDGRSGIVITAKGQVDLWPEQNGSFVVGPNGVRANKAAGFGKKAATIGGLLQGKIGENGSAFNIGEHYEGTPAGSGTLYLTITPSTYSAVSTGSYEVRASRKD
jgi:hypothetical protein